MDDTTTGDYIDMSSSSTTEQRQSASKETNTAKPIKHGPQKGIPNKSWDNSKFTKSALKNREIRQSELRRELANKGLVQQVLEAAKRISDEELTNDHVNRLKIAAELRLKLINKYLPDLKSVEHSGEVTHTAVEASDAELLNLIAAKRVIETSYTVESSPVALQSPTFNADTIPATSALPQAQSQRIRQNKRSRIQQAIPDIEIDESE